MSDSLHKDLAFESPLDKMKREKPVYLVPTSEKFQHFKTQLLASPIQCALNLDK